MPNQNTLLRSITAVGASVTALAFVTSLVVPELLSAGSLPPVSISTPPAEPVRALLVGGGPCPDHNQIAIESNVRYLLKLLPLHSQRTVLFADGDRQKETVLFEASQKTLKPAEKLLALLLEERENAHPANLKFRKPTIPQIDGPSRKPALKQAVDKLSSAQPANAPLLLYFTGHGSQNKANNLDDNSYDLWDEEPLSVRELAAEIKRIPASQPITLVMVQCYSGSFANLLFEDGDPKGPAVDRDIAGFFAAIRERVAAGCTPEVDEAEYRDFTSYFFAALSGRDRVGRKVTGADYDRNGAVTMDEAFCYTLVNDVSIDVPVCTSDIYLRKVVATPDAKVFETTYPEALKWASPAQKAALEQISEKLKLTGDDRAKKVYDQLFGPSARYRKGALFTAFREFGQARESGRRLLFSRWPDLREEQSTAHAQARKDALGTLDRWIADDKFKDVFSADEALVKAEEEDIRREIEDARLIRFVRLFKSVVLAHQLKESGDAAAMRRYERLIAAEGRRPSFIDPNPRVAASP